MRPHLPTQAVRDVRPVRRRTGFTLLEVILVVILLAVLAAVLAPRMTGLDVDQASAVEALKVRLRYAQMRAMAGDSIYGVCSDGAGYWLFSGGDINNRETFPGAEANVILLESGMTMESFTVSFDERGTPYTSAAATAGSELLLASAAASISVGGEAAAVRITPQTGYIPD